MPLSSLFRSSSRRMAPITIEMTSDTICPFCIVGYRRITSAMEEVKAAVPGTEFTFKLKPFQLDPTLPETPISKKERYEQKFGAARMGPMQAQMKQRGLGDGINFSFGGPISQTTRSHRVLEKAYQVGGEAKQRALVERIFSGYFEHEKDPGDLAFLSEEAVAVGVFPTVADAQSFFASSELKDEVQKGYREAYAAGISGVPFTVLNGQYAVSGAQDREVFVEVLKKLATGGLGKEDLEGAGTC